MRAQEYKRLTNLPHVVIKTFDGQGVSSKTVYKYATMWYVDEVDSVMRYDSLEIRGRGNSTWGFPKKPYKIRFQQKEKFLGKGYAKCRPWTLMANMADKSLIRNAITSEMGDFLGLKFNPARKFVDLTLNGVYVGNYQISDHVDVRPHRVNITEQDLPLTEESDITGGYLLEVDGFADGNCFTSGQGVKIRIHYPEEEEIDASQNLYIREYIKDFEAALFGENYQDSVEGYRPMVDSLSLAKWFIATEVSANIDGYYSTYFYKEQGDGRLFFGPLWDYDIAYDNDTRITPNAERLMTDYGYGDTKKWLNRMWNDPWFIKLINREYNDALDRGLVSFMYGKIDSLATLLDESQTKNYEKWGISTRRYHEVVLYSSYDQYLQYIKDFIAKHTAWLKTTFKNKMPKEPEKPTPEFAVEDYYYRFVNKGSGTAIDLLNADTISGRACGWAVSEDRPTQDWVVKRVGDYLHVTARCGGRALNDTGEASTTGTQLTLAEPDSLSDRQLWTFVPQGTGGYYNLKNKYTGHAANLSGGNKANGASVISYTSDTRDATSNNRLWLIEKHGELPEEKPEPAVIACPDAFDYVLAYNPEDKYLHFGTEDRENLDFTVSVYTSDGRKVGEFGSDEQFYMGNLPGGVYVVTWIVDGVRRSVKVRN